MQPKPLRTTVIGSYPFPGWLEFASQHLDQFGSAEIAEMQDDAVIAAVHDQTTAGLDVITDGEQTRLDFNLSFYGFLDGIELDLFFAWTMNERITVRSLLGFYKPDEFPVDGGTQLGDDDTNIYMQVVVALSF